MTREGIDNAGADLDFAGHSRDGGSGAEGARKGIVLWHPEAVKAQPLCRLYQGDVIAGVDVFD